MATSISDRPGMPLVPLPDRPGGEAGGGPPAGPGGGGSGGGGSGGGGSGGGGSGGGRGNGRSGDRRLDGAKWRRLAGRSVPATVALGALTLAVALGLGRLFDGAGFVVPVVATTLAAHGVAWWCRRRGVPTAPAALATAAAVALVAAWTIFGHTTAYGLPLSLTLRSALDSLSAARGSFAVVKAPTDVVPGFVLATVLALGMAAFLADWAAFRLEAMFEAMIPALSLFIFTAALGSDRHRTLAIAAFVASALAFVVLHGMGDATRAGAWFGARSADGPSSLARNAALLGALALVAGLVVGPRLPGATDDPLVRYKNRGPSGPSSRSTISPLVDIRGRLVDHAGVEVFTVKSDVKAYWRLTSLDTFNGTIWSSNGNYQPTKGAIPADLSLRPDIPTLESQQEFEIAALSSIWLPAPFRPQRVDGVKNVSYNSDTGSLITKDETTTGLTYTVSSRIPQPTADLLAASVADPPADILDRYLDLPTIATPVRGEAERVTRDAPTPYAKALALQNYFRDGSFTYDLGARSGHDNRALQTFLLDTRRGYCEQFAGAYAVLARLAGLPSRVAVGFTPGELQADGLYHVRDQHAHAWPEVYLTGAGWVAFEPTPGRGAPNSQQYTQVPEAQSTGDADSTPTAAAAPDDTLPEGIDETLLPEFGTDSQLTPLDTGERGMPAIFVLLLALAGAAALWAVVVPALHLLVRWRRWRAADAEPAPADDDVDDRAGGEGAGAGGAGADESGAGGSGTDRHRTGGRGLVGAGMGAVAGSAKVRRPGHVLAAWADVEESLERAGVPRRPAETMFEFSDRAAPSAGLQREPNEALRQVARDAAVAAYAGSGLSAERIESALAKARVVRAAVLKQLTLWSRLRWWLDPRPLLRRRTPTA